MPDIKVVSDVFLDVETFEQLEARALAQGAATRAFSELTERAEQPLAHVNSGRWLIMCPVCNNGVPCDPEWPQTVCVECGAIYSPIFPDELGDIDAALAERPIANQNWVPGETLEQLAAENIAHGVSPGGMA